jgi:hypothetical protein
LPSLHRLADNTSVSCCSSGAISVCIFLFLSLLCFCLDWLHVGEHFLGGNKKAAGISPSGLLAFSDVKSVTSGSPGGL